jgi:enterochelin esterase-like enzyme
MKIRFFFIAVLLFASTCSLAQKKPMTIQIGETRTIHSSILSEERQLMIYNPETVSQKLPLIIVFDAESLFETSVAAVKFMNYSSEIPQMPEAVVVGVRNTNRDRDMPIPQQYGVGQTEKNFMNFIKEELIPWLNKQYKLNGHTIVIGHSQGGLFVSYLVAESPGLFPWAIALDAPVNVDAKTNKLKEILSSTINKQADKLRYASIESVYGWGNQWVETFAQNKETMQIKLLGESHESMPYMGIYKGLSFLFKDFAPQRKDHSLAELKEHYRFISKNYAHPYEIPLRVLTASASRKLTEGRKNEILELVEYAELKYTPNYRTTKLKEDALKIAERPNSIIDSILSLPKPSIEQIAKYRGRWVGQKVVPRGQNMLTDLEIVVEGGEAKLFTVVPWDPSKKEKGEIFHVTKAGKLVFGRRNGGGGLFVSTCEIDGKGHISGEERLVGFAIPEDESADFKEMMNFVLKNPNTFSLIKK